MGTTRKLQSEIDRTLKKVQEGVELFDEIWNKVYSATNANQKEKYEADLKKEIKKLQRYRDDIKTWIAKSDIKDKRPLTDARKAIEAEMERFKVCEKEFKTKAFSKEGLGQARKEDPKEAERNKTRKWLTTALSSLQDQIDALEAEIEAMGGKAKKGKGAKTAEDLEGWVEKHRLHERRVEQILRMIDNETLLPEQANGIQDQLEYYLESNQDPDFADDEGMYDDLGLDDLPEERDEDEEDEDEQEKVKDEPPPPPEKEKKSKKDKEDKKAEKESAAAAKKAKQKEEAAAAAAAKAAAKQPVAAAAKAATPAKTAAAAVAASPARPAKASGPAPPTAAAAVVAGATAAQVARGVAGRGVGAAGANQPTAAAVVSARGTTEEAKFAAVAAKGAAAAAQPSAAAILQQQARVAPDAADAAARPSAAAPPAGNSWGVPLRPSAGPQAQAGPATQPPQPPPPPPPHMHAAAEATASMRGAAQGKVAAAAAAAAAQPPPPQQLEAASMAAQPQLAQQLEGADRSHWSAPSEPPHAAPDSASRAEESAALSSLLEGAAAAQSAAGGAAASGADGWLKGLAQGQLSGQKPGEDAVVVGGMPSEDVARAQAVQPPAGLLMGADRRMGGGAGASGAGAVMGGGAVDGGARMDDTSARLRALESSLRNIPVRPVSMRACHARAGAQLRALTPALLAHTRARLPAAPRCPARLCAQDLRDSERPKAYVPRNPYPTPGSFPQTPAPVFDFPSIFEKFDTDTLFFIFYYQQGTYQQYLAARELKKQSWCARRACARGALRGGKPPRDVPPTGGAHVNTRAPDAPFRPQAVPQEVPHLVPAARGAQGDDRRVRAGHVRLLRLRDRLVPAHQDGLHLRVRLPGGRAQRLSGVWGVCACRRNC